MNMVTYINAIQLRYDNFTSPKINLNIAGIVIAIVRIEE